MKPTRRASMSSGLRFACLFFAVVTAFAGEPYRPVIAPSNFTHVITNPYYPLIPGTVTTFFEQSGQEKREIRSTVTHDTKMILGVKCVVVHDTITLRGKLVEDTYDWYAQDQEGAVWYFGEATQEFLSGGRVRTAGSWEAGVNGAQPGIVMPAHPRVGDRYRMEYAANEAEDVGRIAALNETVTVPGGTFTNCVRTKEWSMLESGTSTKWYAKGVGLIRDDSAGGDQSTLVSVTRE